MAESAWLAGYREDKEIKMVLLEGPGEDLSETLGKGEIFIYQKGQRWSFLRNPALDPATPLGRRSSQLL